MGLFFVVGPVSRSYQGLKFPTNPTGESLAWTPRVSIATWNPKEAASEAGLDHRVIQEELLTGGGKKGVRISDAVEPQRQALAQKPALESSVRTTQLILAGFRS